MCIPSKLTFTAAKNELQILLRRHETVLIILRMRLQYNIDYIKPPMMQTLLVHIRLSVRRIT